jgi:uncharacterized protein YcfJ
MNKLLAPTLILSSLLLAACAQTRGYTPAIDTRTSNPSATANIDRDIQECQALAEQAAGNTAAETGIGAVAGGALGAATGAIVGVVSGKNVGKAAIIGATAGGIGGAAKQGFESNSKYQQAYKNCMSARGHSVVQ